MTIRLIAALGLTLIAVPAFATGKMTCSAARSTWQSQDALVASLTKAGWTVRKAKVDGGCYEVYGTTPEGDKVEAYFDPASFDKLLVSRRGEVLFKK